MRKHSIIAAAVVLAGLSLSLGSVCAQSRYYVSPNGDDSNPGTLKRPFKSIQRAADIMRAGDTCYIREGIYRQEVKVTASGSKGKPISFEAYKNEKVVLDGTDQVKGVWSVYKGNIYKIRVGDHFDQLFVDGRMMIEARWPNMTFYQIYDRSRWAQAGEGSWHGKVVNKEITKTGIDWTGAMACLNVAHQWWTWHRRIEKHTRGTDTLYYAADLVGLCKHDPSFNKDTEWLRDKWADDYFYLFGKLEALDAETEWYRDPASGWLYLYAPDGRDPSKLNVKYKVRNYGFYVKNANHIRIKGIKFFACTFLLEDCNWCLIEDCRLLYPTYTRTITEYDQNRKESIISKIVGDHNIVRKVSMAFANNMGLMVMGNYNKVTNCIIHDINWFGTLIYPALQLSASPHLGVNWFNTIQYPPTERTIANSDVTSYGNVASHNTLYNSGNTILVYHAAESIVEYNHIYNGGKASKDVSLIYGCWPFTRGSIVRYNWVHDCQTDDFSGRGAGGGIGIRADDQSRNNIIHHNVVWDCGLAGILIKGEDNLAYNNTVFDVKAEDRHQMYLRILKRPEPIKPWAVKWPQLQVQNQWTEVYNNIAYNITSSLSLNDLLEDSCRIGHNFTGADTDELPLMDVKNLDFRPRRGSPLIDAGRQIPGYTDGFKGKAPDIGAYEYGGDRWAPGADWKEDTDWHTVAGRQ